MPYLLGIDFGTTNVKAVAYDLKGQARASASTRTETESEGPGRAVYHPDKVWEEVCTVLKEVVGALEDTAKIEALAVTSVGESGVPVGSQGQWLYPAIAWFDNRTLEQHLWWEREFGADEVFDICGLPLDLIYSINKMMWLKEHEPEIFRRMACWLCMADYITYRLTGAFSTSYSLASRTMAFDLKARDWSGVLLDAAGVKPEAMPPAYPSGEVVGRVTTEAAEETGLPAGLPVVTGGHDHICGALAVGVFEPGPVLDSMGTAEALLITVDDFRPEGAAHKSGLCYGCHVARDRYYLVGGIVTAGGSVEWLRELFWPGRADDETLYQTIIEEASAGEAGGLFFVPHLSGGGAPHRDPQARGIFFGLSAHHRRKDLLRAAFEGLSYEARTLLEALQRYSATELDILRAIGGGAKNELWMRLKADITGKTVEVPALKESTSLGAAILAGLGVGIYSDEKEAVSKVYKVEKTIAPDQAAFQNYDRCYKEIYRNLYPLLRDLSAKIALPQN